MSSEQWFKVDNVAKVFLATHNRRDTRSLRISCTLTEAVNPEILQLAVDKTIESRTQFQVRIRRGFFWHYLESTDARPVVTMESGRPCPVLYGDQYKGVLHYSVNYYGNRINLDLFHALSDGTGAMEFLNIIVANYLELAHPDKVSDVTVGSGASAGALEQDSFSQFYDKGRTVVPTQKEKKAYHIHSLRLPYDQLQFIEIRTSASEMLKRAKEVGVSLTSYISARFMLAIYSDMPILKRNQPVTISMPVNLRNFYPSETSRNFFNSVNVSHVFKGDETLEDLAREFDTKLRENLQPEKIKQQMADYQKLERLFFIRMVPLFIKQPVVKWFSRQESKHISMVVSNLGIIKPDPKISPYIARYSAFCSHTEVFTTVSSYGDDLTLGITYAFNDTGMLQNFARGLTNEGLEVTVNATEVVR